MRLNLGLGMLLKGSVAPGSPHFPWSPPPLDSKLERAGSLRRAVDRQYLLHSCSTLNFTLSHFALQRCQELFSLHIVGATCRSDNNGRLQERMEWQCGLLEPLCI